ncbi:hypothetical protein DFQ28_011079 [Apophysomyces sp. BC1034]|nr:hypothetical protein DFQ30_010143 [Apophysomyces sp. BC1015]KAG0170895.1 hypothetical protein DFQ29_009090 [Apophysomyces sp. BC1021]KAG0184473.1 hypothetical protein DFQ28_011079 [Apophysomyces sp. BC1034]
MQSDKPSLPSIQHMLEGGPGLLDYPPSKPIRRCHGHRRHASEHIPSTFRPPLPAFPSPLPPPPPPLQPHVSLSAATLPFEMQALSISKKSSTPNLHHTFQPSPPPPPPPPQHTAAPHAASNARRRTHSRSFSDFSHPYSPHRRIVFGDSSSVSTDETKEETMSATTIDETTTSSSASPPPTPPPLPPTTPTTFSHRVTQEVGKYICRYCQKAFTRPSSLRTHIYSHTGEKPFECTEEGCGRKFSVQSNLRRHLRIHRLARPQTTTSQ